MTNGNSHRPQRIPRVYEVPEALLAHAEDLERALHHLQNPVTTRSALAAVEKIREMPRRQKKFRLLLDIDRTLRDCADDYNCALWRVVAAVLYMAACDRLCPSSARRQPDLPPLSAFAAGSPT